MHESFHITLLGNTLNIILSTYSGPEALTCVFEVIYIVSFEHTEQMKYALKSIELVDFNG